MDAMFAEMDLHANFLADKNLSSVYFGGGTPSLLEEVDLGKFIEKTHQLFEVADDAEITLEANPDDLTAEKLRFYKNIGINRLSIGTQSFFDDELILMNRSHRAQQAISAVKRAQDAGLENITIDLIFGMPKSTLSKWKENIETAISLEVPHFSAYSLTTEPKTALHKMVENGSVILPTEAESLAQYRALCDTAKTHGFMHYELSNYGKPGFESRHNTSYWNGTPYLGIGPSAHSFDGENRQWNVANNTVYAKYISAKKDWFERENISEKDRFNEMVMTGLRTAKGVNIHQIENLFGAKIADQLLADAAAKMECGKLQFHENQLTIPEEYWMLSDGIIADLFWV